MADSLIDGNIQQVYLPLKNVLIDVADGLPTWLTPNRVTLLSLLCALPTFYFAQREYYICAALSILAHDVLDRLDGAVAVSQHKRGIRRKGDMIDGAFFDAMVDKVFGVVQLLALQNAARVRSMGGLWLLMWLKVAVLLSLSLIRLADFFDPKPTSAIKARGEGKYATAAENAATVCACLCFACTGPIAARGIPPFQWWKGSMLLRGMNAVHLLALLLLSTSADLGADSFMCKWRMRYPPAEPAVGTTAADSKKEK